jgi:hypothetical protein
MPGAAAVPTPGLAGESLTQYGGQIPWANPPLGQSRLLRLAAAASAAGRLIVCDRLWHNSGIVITQTSAQTINSTTWPARCPVGSGEPNTNGLFIGLALEASTAIGGGAVTNTTATYTNQGGVANRTATLSWPATAAAGTFVEFNLQAGDTGVRSVQSLTLVAYRRIFALELPDLSGRSEDALTSGYPRFFDDSVLFFLWHPTATTSVTICGEIQATQPG